MKTIHIIATTAVNVLVALVSAGARAEAAPSTVAIAPANYLKTLAPPKFHEGHTLPPLTRFGWVLDFDTRVELAANWGYALEWGGYADAKSVDRALNDPKDDGARCMALAAKDPKRYKLAVICSRELPKNDAVPIETWTRDAEGKFLNGQAKSMDGTAWNSTMDTVYSPNAPDSVWKEAGRLRADPMRRIREKCPIAVILNGGEYGLGVVGFAKKAWEQDPAVLKAKGDKPWYDYVSERKARAELLIADAVRAEVKDRELYIYYVTSGGPNRNHAPDWRDWGAGFEWMKPVSDLASSEHYYRQFNSGWTGSDDILTQALNAKGYEIAQGQPLAYDWLCGGWKRDKGLGSGAPDPLHDGGFGDISRYTGFLKCAYTSGMVGGNAGYYDFPAGGFNSKFDPAHPPHWLLQMTVTGQVHALFSFLESYLRQGDLLPGPGTHAWSKEQPAYEFPTGDEGTRVLARKLRDRPQWLITAWAADGRDRVITTEIPILGQVRLQARSVGSIFEASIKNGKPELKQID